jgi:hypothetical protein
MSVEEKATFDAEPNGRKRLAILAAAWDRFLRSSDGWLYEQRGQTAMIRDGGAERSGLNHGANCAIWTIDGD